MFIKFVTVYSPKHSEDELETLWNEIIATGLLHDYFQNNIDFQISKSSANDTIKFLKITGSINQ